ncbi:MAG: AMP-binding protein [Treponema sp.]|nr:AMP-binding protein [Treponema sp.]
MIFPPDFTVPKMLQKSAVDFAEIPAQKNRNKDGSFTPVLFRELFQTALDFGAALISLGVQRQQPVGLIADNREEWLDASMGIMSIGAFDVPRGCDATPGDLEKILSITDCKIVVAENGVQVKKLVNLKESLPALETIICFNDDLKDDVKAELEQRKMKFYLFQDLLNSGKKWRVDHKGIVEAELDKGTGEEIATIIFTSGTTGNPKGVMLTHHNFLIQLDETEDRIYMAPGQGCLSVLPVWHVFEREMEYIVLSQGGTLCYSKPIVSMLLADLKTLNPSIFPSVPRVFEAIYDSIHKSWKKAGPIPNAMFKFFVKLALIHKRMERCMFGQNPCFTTLNKPLWWILFFIPWFLMWPLYGVGYFFVYRNIKAVFGSNFTGGVTGGGSFPKKVDEFFWATGVRIIEAYGLTETAPMVAMRPMACPIFRTIGTSIRHVQVRVVDPNDGFVLGRCQQGVLQVKGPTVMKGYYKRPDLTEKAINPEGWFDTGDLAIITKRDEIQIKGRIKDTIVLLGGENLEPVPIEAKLSESKYIARAVVVGQDQRYLGALILVDKDEIITFAEEFGIPYDGFENLIASEQIQKLYESEIGSLINSKNGFKIFERVNKFVLLTEPFSIGVELSAKQEVMRHRVSQIYKDQIDSMFEE